MIESIFISGILYLSGAIHFIQQSQKRCQILSFEICAVTVGLVFFFLSTLEWLCDFLYREMFNLAC